MSPESQALVREAVKLAGDALAGKLPPSPRHPKGRNPHAHVWSVIRSQMGGKSYRDCSDDELLEIIDAIERCVRNPF